MLKSVYELLEDLGFASKICERIFIKILEKIDAAISEVISRVKLNKIAR